MSFYIIHYQNMILNTKSLNELIRKLQEKPEIEGCFLTAKNSRNIFI
jgi:hypothetical protein